MKTYHIHINGIVQGVGFRPFVYLAAQQLGIQGKVRNDADGVNVWFNSTYHIATQFFNILTTQAPSQAKILSSNMEEIPYQPFALFSIDTEHNNTQPINTLVSPDYRMCDACKKELYDTKNKRYRYPFITCTQCGPRFSIINKLPYERYDTAMDNFLMCPHCKKEYLTITDRRYFSQTNSCAECGVTMTLWDQQAKPLLAHSEDILSYCKKSFHAGKIVAIKGVGGYLLLCDAHHQEAIKTLRQRKLRPTKPFAVLYPTIEKVMMDFEISDTEKQYLQSPAAPILLLSPKPHINNHLALNNITNHLAFNDIAPRLNTIGVMLPANPLLELIVTDFGHPLVATSANISGSPIIYDNHQALQYLFSIADSIVMNNRDIVLPQDDSVLRFPKADTLPLFIRRSRGYAPIYDNSLEMQKKCILSFGAMLKSTFAMSVHKHIFVSQYLGAGGNYEYEESYKKTMSHFVQLYQAKPQYIVADMHPHYFTHQLAKEMSQNIGVPCINVQHHKAHFAAVLAENNLMDTPHKILGIIWDGTGLGTDGNIWGSECFLYQQYTMNRVAHFQYFKNIAADKLAIEPRLALLSIWGNKKEIPHTILQKFSPQETKIYQQLITQKQIKNSSAGRLIDAVASLLNLCDKSTYEGEAAMYLQIEAEKYIAMHGYCMNEIYGDFNNTDSIDIQTILQQMVVDKNIKRDSSFMAAKFHYSLVAMIKKIAEKQGLQKICFSGGVFQNTLLVTLLKHHLCQDFELYFHRQLSPNDENISLGQLFYVDRDIDA